MTCCVLQVVTGSTHGIGKAYAQELASHGMDILVISIGDEDCQHTCTLLGLFFFVLFTRYSVFILLNFFNYNFLHILSPSH